MPTHRVKFEPVDIEIDVDQDENVLHAAFRQGLMLAHGCKAGQCSACKAYLIEGDTDLAKYSTFALSDMEREEGYTLLCKTHVYSDTVIELLHYDEEMLRNANPIRTVPARVAEIEALTHDIRRLRLTLATPGELTFAPGQYVDVHVPGSDQTRSFSMANTPAQRDYLEFIIKLYPGGLFSGLLEGSLESGRSARRHGTVRNLRAARAFRARPHLHGRRRRHGAAVVAASARWRRATRSATSPSTTARARRAISSSRTRSRRSALGCRISAARWRSPKSARSSRGTAKSG